MKFHHNKECTKNYIRKCIKKKFYEEFDYYVLHIISIIIMFKINFIYIYKKH